MRLRLLRFGVMLFGAFIGYLVLVIACNWEDRPLYTLRAAITGETIPMRISDHPANGWIAPALFVTLCTSGATLAALALETIRHVRKPPAE